MKRSVILFALLLPIVVQAQSGEKLLNAIDAATMETIRMKATGETLTNGQVLDAIAAGQADKNRSGADIGLTLEDTQQKWSNAMSAFGNNANSRGDQHSGFALRVLTPMAWVEWNAHEAKRSYKPFAVDDVGDTDKLPLIRVIVRADKPYYVSANNGMRASSSVEHVVMRSLDGKMIVQPLAVMPYNEDVKNAMGGAQSYNSVIAIFGKSEVDALRQTTDKSEFNITVVGESGKERNFQVKTKHFAKLV